MLRSFQPIKENDGRHRTKYMSWYYSPQNLCLYPVNLCKAKKMPLWCNINRPALSILIYNLLIKNSISVISLGQLKISFFSEFSMYVIGIKECNEFNPILLSPQFWQTGATKLQEQKYVCMSINWFQCYKDIFPMSK